MSRIVFTLPAFLTVFSIPSIFTLIVQPVRMCEIPVLMSASCSQSMVESFQLVCVG